MMNGEVEERRHVVHSSSKSLTDGSMDPPDVNALQGPGSLSSRENTENDDFIILSNGYEDMDIAPFDSLSQADAVAQLKETIVQRDDLQRNFSECTQRLNDLTTTCDKLKTANGDLQVQEREKCEQARTKIGEMSDSVALYKTENDRLMRELSSVSKSTLVGAGRESPDHSLNLSSEKYPTRCTSGISDEQLADAVHDTQVSIRNLSLKDAEIEELRIQIDSLHDEKLQLSQQIEAKEEQIKVHKEKRESAERKYVGISTKFSNFRSQKEQELSAAEHANNELGAKNAELVEQIRCQTDEFQSEQRTILDGLRKKCQDLERQLQEQRQLNTDLQVKSSDWQNKYHDLEVVCRELDNDKSEVSHDSEKMRRNLETRCRDLEGERNSLQNTTEQLQSKQQEHGARCSKFQAEIEGLKGEYEMLQGEKMSVDETYRSLQRDKNKADEAIRLLRTKIVDCTRMMETVKEVKVENQRLAEDKAELTQRVERLGQSFGDEVPVLIKQCDDAKDRLRDELNVSEGLRDEKAQLVTKGQKDAEHYTRVVTDVRQEIANVEGENARLRREVGELNSRNAQAGKAATYTGYGRLNQLGGSPLEAVAENTPLGPPSPAASSSSSIAHCPFGCGVSGDEDLVNNHIARDHPE